LQWQKAVNIGFPEASMVISPQMHFPGKFHRRKSIAGKHGVRVRKDA